METASVGIERLKLDYKNFRNFRLLSNKSLRPEATSKKLERYSIVPKKRKNDSCRYLCSLSSSFDGQMKDMNVCNQIIECGIQRSWLGIAIRT